MKPLKYFIVLFVFILQSCISTQVANLQRHQPGEVEVYTTKKPTREYVEMQYIQADGNIFHTHEKLLKKLAERAKKEGADAIINVHYGYQFWWPYVAGTTIKYSVK
jgi:uncharacterized protein YbjQ (UPF0145 family)